MRKKALGARGKKKPKESPERKCKICGTKRGMIHRYRLQICRRCFREVAESMGFTKY